MTTPIPNTALRAARLALRLSQDDLARQLRAAGARIGEPNDASKRLVQRWESGTTLTPRPSLARALEAVTGMPLESLGFSPVPGVTADGAGGHDMQPADPIPAQAAPGRPGAAYSGVWLSRYDYYSSSRNETYTSKHYVVLLQHADRLTARSLPGAGSQLSMDLSLDGNVVTGTWTEVTQVDGYYRGARYHGAIQMLAEPTGRRISGKWVGFGKDMDVNTGPWELIFQDASSARATRDAYSRSPE